MIDMLLFMKPGALDPVDARYFPVMPSFEPRPAGDDDFETDIDSNGTLTIARKGDGPLRTPDAALMHIQTGQSVCNACLSALGYLARHLEETITVPDREEMSDRLPPNVVLHWNLLALTKSRWGGYHLCSLIPAYLDPEIFSYLEIMQDLRVELVLRSQSATELGAEDTRLACVLTPNSQTDRTSDNYREVFKLRLWPSPDNDVIFPRRMPVGDDESPSRLESASRVRTLNAPSLWQ